MTVDITETPCWEEESSYNEFSLWSLPMGDDSSVKVGRGIKHTNSQGVCGCVPGEKSGVRDTKIISNYVLRSKNHGESGLCEKLGAGDESHEGDFVGQRHYWP